MDNLVKEDENKEVTERLMEEYNQIMLQQLYGARNNLLVK